MNELEQKLKAMRLAAPSAELDRRMSEIFVSAARTQRRTRMTFLWWWLAAFTACGATAALLFVLMRPQHPPAKQITYRIEAQGRMRQLLLEPPASASRLPRFDVKTSTP